MMKENMSRLQRAGNSLLRGLTFLTMVIGCSELAWGHSVDFSGSKTGDFLAKYVDYNHYYDSTEFTGYSAHVVVVNQAGYTIDKLTLTQKCFGSKYGFNIDADEEILTYEHSVTREENLLSQQAGIFWAEEPINLEGDTQECVYLAKVWILGGVVREYALGRGNRAIFFQGTTLHPNVSRWSDNSVSCVIDEILFGDTLERYNCDLRGSGYEPSNGVEVFEHCDYRGYSQKLQTGDYTLSTLIALGIKNDDLSSIKIPKGYEVLLFERDNFQGTPVVLTSDNASNNSASCFAYNRFNDKVSSIKVRQQTHRWTFDETDEEANGSGLYVSGSFNYTHSTAPSIGTNLKAVKLDGVSDYLSIPDSDRLEFGPNDDFTVALWVKADHTQPSSNTPDNAILAKWSGQGGYPYTIRYMNQTGKIRVARYDGSNFTKIDSSASINDEAYHHIAFVKNGSTLKLYIDGVENGQTTDKTSGSTSNNSDLYLGMRGGPTSIPFRGWMDDLRIYSYAIKPDLISKLANHGKIQVYENCNFFGTYASVTPNEYKLDLQNGNLGLLNNEISSIRIPIGMKIDVWDYDSVERDESIQALYDEYEKNGSPESFLDLLVEAEEANGPTTTFTQSAKCLKNNVMDSATGTKWNDRISRILVDD